MHGCLAQRFSIQPSELKMSRIAIYLKKTKVQPNKRYNGGRARRVLLLDMNDSMAITHQVKAEGKENPYYNIIKYDIYYCII